MTSLVAMRYEIEDFAIYANSGIGLEGFDFKGSLKRLSSVIVSGLKTIAGRSLSQSIAPLRFKNGRTILKSSVYTDMIGTKVYVPDGLIVGYLDLAETFNHAMPFLKGLDSLIYNYNMWLATMNDSNSIDFGNAPDISSLGDGTEKSSLAGCFDISNHNTVSTFDTVWPAMGPYEDTYKIMGDIGVAFQNADPKAIHAKVARTTELAELLFARVQKGELQMVPKQVEFISTSLYALAQAVELYGVYMTMLIKTNVALNKTDDDIIRNSK